MKCKILAIVWLTLYLIVTILSLFSLSLFSFELSFWTHAQREGPGILSDLYYVRTYVRTYVTQSSQYWLDSFFYFFKWKIWIMQRNWRSLIFKEKSGSWEKVSKFGEKCGFLEFAQKLVVKCHVLTFLNESSWCFWFMVANVIIPKNPVQEIWLLFYLTNHRSHPQNGGNIFIRNQIWT